MHGILRVHWTLTPLHPPAPWRHCAACGTSRAFISSGKIRLNANGRKVDAWLIYQCSVCSRTWNRTLVERRPVQDIAPRDLEAMQHSAPAWVRRHEFDTGALKREADRITQDEEVVVTKPKPREVASMPAEIELALLAPTPIGLRVDRLLSRELHLARSRLRSLQAEAGLTCGVSGRIALKRMVGKGAMVQLRSAAFSDPELVGLLAALFAD